MFELKRKKKFPKFHFPFQSQVTNLKDRNVCRGKCILARNVVCLSLKEKRNVLDPPWLLQLPATAKHARKNGVPSS